MPEKVLRINTNIYYLIRQLGSGASGGVYLARRESDHLEFAIKIIRVESQRSKMYLENEIQTTLWLSKHTGKSCPFLRLEEYSITGDSFSDLTYFLVTEYIESQNLLQYIKSNPNYTEHLHVIFRQLLLAVNILHSFEIVHRDIKLENVLIIRNPDSNLIRIILIDFGFVCNRHPLYLYESIEELNILRISSTCTEKHDMGTPPYVAPELIEKRRLTFDELKKADLWACGVFLYVMIYQRFPFKSPNTILSELDLLILGLSNFEFDHSLKLNQKNLLRKFAPLLKSIFVPVENRPSVLETIFKHSSVLSVDPTVIRSLSKEISPVDSLTRSLTSLTKAFDVSIDVGSTDSDPHFPPKLSEESTTGSSTALVLPHIPMRRVFSNVVTLPRTSEGL